MPAIYRTPLAGSWYPCDPGQLQDLLAELFRESETRVGSSLRPGARGFLVPHAGLMYSGAVAASAFRHLAGARPEVVVILAFLHSRRHPGIALPAPSAYDTPLGQVPVDLDTIRLLARKPPFECSDAHRFSDHSAEIQLPLLQWACPGARVVIAYIGDIRHDERLAAADALAALPPSTLLVASSDLTHYGRHFGYQPFPPDSGLEANLRRLDMATLEAASSLDPALFSAELRKTGTTVCGRAPIALLLESMRQASGMEIFQQTLDYRTSTELTRDRDSSVSYGAAAYFPANSFALNPDEAERLLSAAQQALERYAAGEARPYEEPDTSTAANVPGLFVTLHRNGELQGCLGRLDAAVPLSTLVPSLALAAALDDPRFESLPRAEFARLSVDLSVLTPRKLIASADHLHLGLHGAILQADSLCGLLLPQVGRREGWTRERFLRALSHKARLGDAGWLLPGAKLSVFQAFCYQRHPTPPWRNYEI